MCDDDWLKTHTAVCNAFENGSVIKADDDALQAWLRNLSTGNTVNETIRYREIIRALTINHIQMKRHINGLNRQNSITQCCVIALTVMSLIGSGFQIWYAKKADQRSVLLQQQEQPQPTEEKTVALKTGTGANKQHPPTVLQSHQATPKKDSSKSAVSG